MCIINENGEANTERRHGPWLGRATERAHSIPHRTRHAHMRTHQRSRRTTWRLCVRESRVFSLADEQTENAFAMRSSSDGRMLRAHNNKQGEKPVSRSSVSPHQTTTTMTAERTSARASARETERGEMRLSARREILSRRKMSFFLMLTFLLLSFSQLMLLLLLRASHSRSLAWPAVLAGVVVALWVETARRMNE